jgi:hypothetical protein
MIENIILAEPVARTGFRTSPCLEGSQRIPSESHHLPRRPAPLSGAERLYPTPLTNGLRPPHFSEG